MAQQTVCAYALSEAGSGSDAFSLASHARLDGDAYVLNGRKLWISNAMEADMFLVFSTINPDAGYKGITFKRRRIFSVRPVSGRLCKLRMGTHSRFPAAAARSFVSLVSRPCTVT